MTFESKIVIITGASSGIGAGAAIHFSKLGANIVITGRNEINLKEIQEKCGSKVLAIVADVNDEADRHKIINSTIENFGRIDVLVNNAGVGEAGTILTTSLEQYDKVMNTNVRSVFHLTQLATPYLIKTRGNIVNVSSVAGPRQFPNLLSYCMSKAALDQFTKCVALELAPEGVRVNSINPAFIVTNFHKRLGMNEEAYESFKLRAKETHALGRVGTTEETANAIAFLANNDLASFITGTCLLVDGGKAVMCPR
ncbi:CLUMA_CG000088, isoform A [Clunio marinus]|uniref:CLUMA_CG000088, isoform A n=1 Tax=Clunio marinus TaxID=568069 RepID=A0A1J1HFM4_9DIPT|nr:CLUMA_CG000088, isoform A [Clunio marinus]